MRSDLTYTYTNDMTAYEWLMFRKNGIGASENSALLGIPSYQSALAIFWDKITPTVNVKDENFRMFMGKRQEAQIADLWQYWGGDEQSVIDNYNAKKKVRKCRRVNAFIQNPEFPWLSVSVDRIITKGETGKNGVLEIKNTTTQATKKFTGNIPPSHISQVAQGQLITGLDYGELVHLLDGNKMAVYPIEYNAEFGHLIVEKTKPFWHKVLIGKGLMLEREHAILNGDMNRANEIMQEIYAIEPQPTGSESDTEFLKERYRESEHVGVIMGNIEQKEIAIKYKEVHGQIKKLEAVKAECGNNLLNIIKDKNKLDFGDGSYVSVTVVKKENKKDEIRLNVQIK